MAVYMFFKALLLVLGAGAVDERPLWKAGESSCPSLPGFQVADVFPIRSPLAVADFLGAQVKDKSFCEIGTRNGDVMGCVSHFAKSVTAIEMSPEYCTKLRARGFGVACHAVEEIAPADFPKADVYYWWPSDAGGQNELWLRIVARALRLQGAAHATVYVGHDSHWKPDMQWLPGLISKYNGTVERVYFDEGGAVHGDARAHPVYRAAEHKIVASVAKPFFDRPGHWGVFLLAKFEIGPAMWRRMREVPFSHPQYWGSTGAHARIQRRGKRERLRAAAAGTG